MDKSYDSVNTIQLKVRKFNITVIKLLFLYANEMKPVSCNNLKSELSVSY